MSRHRASGAPSQAWRPRPDDRAPGGTPLSRVLMSLGALVATVAVLAYLISAQPGKAPGSRLVEPSRSATDHATSASRPSGPGSVRALPAPVLNRAERPIRLRLPSIGLDSTLQPLGLLPDGSLQPPSNRQQAGWYAGGTAPGNVGSAVIAGQLDSASVPAVFSRLHRVRPGDPVLITRQDGMLLRFRVDQVRAYAQRTFPTQTVYGPAATPQLRLITDDLVVSAHLA
jgi:hypothetical protein